MGEIADEILAHHERKALALGSGGKDDPLELLLASRENRELLQGKAPGVPHDVERIIAQYLIGLNDKSMLWVTREHEIIPISQMTPSHVANTYEYLVRRTTSLLRRNGYANVDAENVIRHTRFGKAFVKIITDHYGATYWPAERRES